MNVESLIKEMKIRPEMYVGNLSLERVALFISGYLYNNIVTNRADEVDLTFKNHFHQWVRENLERKYQVKFDVQRNYLFYISQIFLNPKEQIDAFFELSSEFFSELHKK